MKRLIDAGLFGQGLTLVDSPVLVGRYNECLKDIGLEPTGLEQFTVDGMGWSPEIGMEKGTQLYLSHGRANQFAIVLSPEQEGKPIYFPFTSYIRYVMKKIFADHKEAIVDITSDAAIWFDLDQDLSHFLSPLDLTMVESVTTEPFVINGLMKTAREQRELVAEFMADDRWFDSGLLDRIGENGKRFGDLRQRNVIIPSITHAIGSFHTLAFNGAAVIRNVTKSGNTILVLEDEAVAKELGKPNKDVFHVLDPKLMDCLFKEGLLDTDLSYYERYQDDQAYKRESILIDALAECRPEVDYHTLSRGQQRKCANDMRGQLPDLFFDLERLDRQIKNGKYPDVKHLSRNLKAAIAYPSVELPQYVREVLWKILTEIRIIDYFRLYIYNKRKFFQLYRGWPDTKKDWAVDHIKRNYRPRMDE